MVSIIRGTVEPQVELSINLDIKEIESHGSIARRYTNKNGIISIPIIDIYENNETTLFLTSIHEDEYEGNKFTQCDLLLYDEKNGFRWWGSFPDEFDKTIETQGFKKLSKSQWVKFYIIKTDMPYVPVS